MDKKDVWHAIGISVALGLVGAASALDFVSAGKALPIATADKPSASTRLAVRELSDYTFKVTGVRPAVVALSSLGSGVPAVVVGTMDALDGVPQQIRGKLAASKSVESHASCVSAGRFWIVGKKDVAELYGVYHLLESSLGVRWFKPEEPDDPGDYVPKAEKVALSDGLAFREPAFARRRLDMVGASCRDIPYKSIEWLLRAGLQAGPDGGLGLPDVELLSGGEPGPKASARARDFYAFYKPRIQMDKLSLGGGHETFRGTIPASKYFAAHPEYFAMRDGKRVPCDFYCHSNPEVRHLVASNVIGKLRTTGGEGVYLFGLMDGIDSAGACECEACRALDSESDRRRRPNECISTRFHSTVAAIVKEVYAAFPQADSLATWAYNIYREPPAESVRIDPRLWVQFCIRRCYAHRLDDPQCSKNAGALAMAKGWLAHGNRLSTYEYGNCSDNWYVPYETRFAEDLKLYRRIGIRGWKEECVFTDSTPPSYWKQATKEALLRRTEQMPSNWQWFYSAGQLLWDPDRPLAAVLEDAESKFYGPAYPAMKKYHALRRRLWDGQTMCMGYPNGDSRTPNALNEPGAKEELLRLLDEAEQLVGGASSRKEFDHLSPTRTRIIQHRLANDRRWLTEYWIKPNDKIRANAGKALRAPSFCGKITVDGRGDEADWTGAYWTTDFFIRDGAKNTPIPTALETKVGILSDGDNLYFLVKAKEPAMDKLLPLAKCKSGLSDKSEFEILLYPPSEGNSYYQIMADDEGNLEERQHQPSAPGSFGTEVAASRSDDGYVLEIRVPVKRIYPLLRGDTWRIQLLRQRILTERDGLTPHTFWTMGGAMPHCTGEYRPLEIGNPYLSNGGFERLDAKGLPTDWTLNGATVATNGALHAVRLLGGTSVRHGLWGAFPQTDKPLVVNYAFKARGSGAVTVSFLRYRDTPDFRAPHGYRRQFLPSEVAKRHPVANYEANYNGVYTIRPGEWVMICLSGEKGGDVAVDDVSVRPLE